MNPNPESFSHDDNNETSQELEKMKQNMERFQDDVRRVEDVLGVQERAEKLVQVGKGKTDIERAKETVLAEKAVERELQGLSIPNLDGIPNLEDLSHPDDFVQMEMLLASLKKGTPRLQWDIMENGGMDHLV